MSGAVDRAARRLLRLRVLSMFLLCVLMFWFAMVAGTYRASNRYLALAVLVGMGLLVLDAALLVRRVSNATPSSVAAHMLEIAARFAPLVVLNLMILNVFAPVLGLIASVIVGMPVLKTWLTILGRLSGQALFGLFVLGLTGLIAVRVMRVLDWAVARWRLVERVVTVGDRAVVVVTGLYCALAMILTFNGTLDRADATEHPSEIIRLWGASGTGLWWADVRSWEAPERLKRVVIFPERDLVVPTLLNEGQPVRVRIRPGFFGLPWVESMRLDFDHEMEPLVAAAPSAAAPRKRLIAMLLRDQRWAEAAAHTASYARYHPNDRALLKEVVASLREARQFERAAALDRLVLPVSQARGSR
jgi:hypothetical protein